MPALQVTREQLHAVVCIVYGHHRGTAAGPSGWTFALTSLNLGNLAEPEEWRRTCGSCTGCSVLTLP